MNQISSSVPHKQIGVAVIFKETGQILIDRRSPKGLLGGFWEFPGGKIEANETVEACIKREILEEIGITIEVGEHLLTLDHTYSHFRVTLIVHCCRYLQGEPRPIECDEVRWVSIQELEQFTFPEANIKIIETLKTTFGF